MKIYPCKFIILRKFLLAGHVSQFPIGSQNGNILVAESLAFEL